VGRKYSDFEKEWLAVFAKGLDPRKMESCVLSAGNYIWHVFSFEMIPRGTYLVGDEARKAFDSQDKTHAKYYEPWPGLKERKPVLDSPTAEELENHIECYVVSRDKTWTYIKTHECDCCGPYFYKLPAGNTKQK